MTSRFARQSVKPTISPSLAATARRTNDPLTVGLEGKWVWGWIVIIFLISLLPWRLWSFAPDLLLLVLAFWCVHDAKRVGLVWAFCLGLLIDVQDATPLGQHAALYLLVCFGGILISRRLQRFDLFGQAIHMMPIFVVGFYLAYMTPALLLGFWPGWGWVLSALFTAVLWVPFGWLLQMPINRLASQALNSN